MSDDGKDFGPVAGIVVGPLGPGRWRPRQDVEAIEWLASDRDSLERSLVTLRLRYEALEARTHALRGALEDIEGYDIDWYQGPAGNVATMQNKAAAAIHADDLEAGKP